MTAGRFGEGVVEYGGWRRALADAVRAYRGWLAASGLDDLATRLGARLDALAQRVSDERVSIAVVAEFSRGKSELINAVFFAEYGRRILPSGAGRTTMCPTELLYDPSRPPSIRLLPIESRLREVPLFELRERSGEWHEILIQPGERESIAGAFDSVRETRRVSVEEAASLGFDDSAAGVRPDAAGRVEIPKWRHAIVNFPDPLLEMGLVVIDTPGLNAIGSEPELTLNMIPNADAVLFVLAADAGVTASDVEVWQRHVGVNHRSGRFVVLNKIDGLWDDLREDTEIDAEIDRQARSVAETLGVPLEAVFPVSAQKGLVARVRRDPSLLARSRLPELEHALSHDILPRQRTLLSERMRRDFDDIHGVVSGVLRSRRDSLDGQLAELEALRGRKRAVVNRLAVRLRADRAEFDQAVRHLQGVRSVVTRHLQSMQMVVGMEALRSHAREARETMRASQFSSGLREAMSRLLRMARRDFEEVGRSVEEVGTLMAAIRETFETEHGLRLGPPPAFSMARFQEELDKIEQLYRQRFGAVSLVTTEKWALMRRFFDSVAAHLKAVYLLAGSECGDWVRELLAPIESQVAERQDQLMQRLESLRRVGEAVDGLDARIAELVAMRDEAERRDAVAAQRATAVLALLDEVSAELRTGAGAAQDAAVQSLLRLSASGTTGGFGGGHARS